MPNNTNLPLWLAFGSALFWGLWWIPVRTLESVGLTGAWAGTAMFAGAIPALLILFLFSKRRISFAPRVILSGAMVGIAMMLFNAKGSSGVFAIHDEEEWPDIIFGLISFPMTIVGINCVVFCF